VLPGWSAFVGTRQVAYVYYNGLSAGGAFVNLITAYTSDTGQYLIAGQYTAELGSGAAFIGGADIVTSTAIAQTGLTPLTAQSLRFAVRPFGSYISDLAVTFNGQDLPLLPLAAGSNYLAYYGADISMFAGQTGELRFTERPISNPNAEIFLDSIQFSDQPIPEPGVVGLVAVAGVLLVGRLVWRRR
jgi:hypothetical protein